MREPILFLAFAHIPAEFDPHRRVHAFGSGTPAVAPFAYYHQGLVHWETILGLSVLGALVTTLGSLLATVVKDFFFARSLERFKAQQQLRQVYLKLRDPLLLSTIDLVNRIAEIAFESTVNFLDPALLQATPSRMTENSADDQYYQRYKFVSTSYRLCVWFGWVEMYRQEITFLDSGQRKTNEDFEHHVSAMRSSLADGHLNNADDWLNWTDSLIFREEQRAIGERMLDASRRTAVGYAEFNARLIPSGSHPTDPWIRLAVDFLSDLKSIPCADERDFRRARCLLLIKHGVSLIECINADRVTTRLRDYRQRAEKEIAQLPILPDKT